jgi:hypothetical protein
LRAEVATLQGVLREVRRQIEDTQAQIIDVPLLPLHNGSRQHEQH